MGSEMCIRDSLDTMKDLTVLEQTVTIRSAVKPGDESALLALADAVHQA
mgnify:CR=1 FL=1